MLLKREGHIISNTTGKLENWKEYIQDILNNQKKEISAGAENSITTKEVKHRIKLSNNNKS